MVERKIGLQIITIQTNKRREFISLAFNQHYQTHDIQRQLTMANTPQQNGVVERCNQTLFETAKCLTVHQDLPQQLWVKTQDLESLTNIMTNVATMDKQNTRRESVHSKQLMNIYAPSPTISHPIFFSHL